MYNPIQMNDWEIKKFLSVVLSMQLALWGVIYLEALNLQIPIVRQLIGFIYLTFIPGIVILRILKLHNLGNIKTLLYSVGLSIATFMFSALLMNSLYPFFGILKPISIVPLIITISIIVLVLCILSYKRDKNFFDPSFINVKHVLSPLVLFLCLIPFLSIFGTYLMNFYNNNILLLVLIIIISVIPAFVIFSKQIPENVYPLIVFIIAISLLYHVSLISMYIWGWDIQHEYYLSNLVITNARWDSTIPYNTNAMLSIVMLAPIYSIVCNMSLVWIFKAFYPLLFSLVPIGLYSAYQKQTNDKIAFLSCFFFVSIFIFYNEMLQLARQQIAELFLVLLILLMIDRHMNKMERSILFIVFGSSLIVSHYGISYIYMFSIISVLIILVLMNNPTIQKIKDNYFKYSTYKNEIYTNNQNSSDAKDRTISPTISLTSGLLFIVFTLTWYIYISSSSPFRSVVRIGEHIASSIFTDLLNPEAAQGLYIITATVPPLHSILKYLHLITQFFIVIGIVTLLLKHGEMKFEKEYTAFSFVNFIICIGGIALPYFASKLNASRLYQISLIFLAPFCVIGCITFFKMLSSLVNMFWIHKIKNNSLKILSIFFIIFLLFNTGFVNEVAKEPLSIALNSTVDYPSFNKQEVLGAKWINDVKDNGPLYADRHRWVLFGSFNNWHNVKIIPKNIDIVSTNSYVYFGTYNLINDKILIERQSVTGMYKYTNSINITNNRNKIYDNGGSVIYH